MSYKNINLTDHAKVIDTIDGNKSIAERLNAGAKKTVITITDHETGKVKGIFENKIVISGSTFNAGEIFGVSPSVVLPNYNNEMNLDNTDDYTTTEPKNKSIVCLFCVDDSGCGATPNDVFVTKVTDRISPDTIMPFRYVDDTNDLNSDLREMYFGRKHFEDEGKVAYYFKAFDTRPQLHLRYADGTQITDDVYNVETDQPAECYIETRLRITRNDFREYFENVLGWDKARISSISLCFAWYDDTIDDNKWYQQISPYTKLNFSFEWLVELSKGIDFNYQIFY